MVFVIGRLNFVELGSLRVKLANCMALTLGSKELCLKLHRKDNKYKDRRLPRRHPESGCLALLVMTGILGSMGLVFILL